MAKVALLYNGEMKLAIVEAVFLVCCLAQSDVQQPDNKAAQAVLQLGRSRFELKTSISVDVASRSYEDWRSQFAAWQTDLSPKPPDGLRQDDNKGCSFVRKPYG